MSVLEKNYFELFDMAQCFDLDVDRLQERYRALQGAVHPDRYASASEQERRLAMQLTAHVNEAFRTLKDPLTRARYLLSQKGVQWSDEGHTINDAEFLMEQMELRERLHACDDSPEPLAEIGSFIDNLDARYSAMIGEMRRCFADNTDSGLTQAKTTIQKMQFLRRLRTEAEAAEEAALYP